MGRVTRILLTFQLNCCGLKGPREFADNNYLMDSTCYEITHGEKRLKQVIISINFHFV